MGASNLNFKSLETRIDRLEKRGRKTCGSIKIVNHVSLKPWMVVQDHETFDTLQEAVKHVKGKYVTKTIKVDQTREVMSHMNEKDLRKIANMTDNASLNENDPAFKPLMKPCASLAQAEHDNPDINFEIFFMTIEERNNYLSYKK